MLPGPDLPVVDLRRVVEGLSGEGGDEERDSQSAPGALAGRRLGDGPGGDTLAVSSHPARRDPSPPTRKPMPPELTLSASATPVMTLPVLPAAGPEVARP